MLSEITRDTIVCVTGICGHLGSVIGAELCRKGCRVRGLQHDSRIPELLQGLPVEYCRGDVTSPDTLGSFLRHDGNEKLCVIHCAGIISIIGGYQEKLHRVNVTGTINMVDAAIRNCADKFVYVSSVHSIAIPQKVKVITETEVYHPSEVIGDYARTKCEATAYVLSQKGKLDVTVVQPSGIMGPYDLGRNDLVALIASVAIGKRRIGVNGGYDMVDVRDIAKGTISALTNGHKGECYILSGHYVSIPDIMKISLKAAGTNGRIIVLPLCFARIAAPFACLYAKLTGKKPLFTPYAIHTVASAGNFSHAKATEELGFDPRPIEETIADTVTYLQKHNRSFSDPKLAG
ncbi:MAG: NAD-dependent epimerase/dehydratase family protein [Bacteroidales bacterium]|jgi:dihydroflavonol-4-reductase|nr:NAD-dependent epimerase/dehydratase family protein [Bacteroidales bacterium]MCI2121374.1 NAD-dependent epimerase/dehydratase family protein [Bacteroidales bacterium]MCI2145507.1 NAD-dependent epimerase/dehydratase family protein [Bacteroidales bacterium]